MARPTASPDPTPEGASAPSVSALPIDAYLNEEYARIQSKLRRYLTRWSIGKWPHNMKVYEIDPRRVWGYWLMATVAMRTMNTDAPNENQEGTR